MKKLIGLIVLIALIFGIWWKFFKTEPTVNEPKPTPIQLSKHSDEFNENINNIVNGYLLIKDAFVNGDSIKAKAETIKLTVLLDSLKLIDIQKEGNGIFQSAQMQLEDMRVNSKTLIQEKNITEMRQDFRMLSESFFPFLKIIHYEGPTLYWQNCPMAFDEDKEGSWISKTEEIVNPYLGKNHPKYKGTMLHCGEVKDSIK